jgi:hypothetical protein
MPDIETLLRDELRGLAGRVDPAGLRPLRAPARRGWRLAGRRRWLIPAGAFAAVAAVVAVVLMLSATVAPGGRPAAATAPGGMPRYYLTVTGSKTRLVATVRDPATGRVTGRLTLPLPGSLHEFDFWQVSAAADDRQFAIAAYSDQAGTETSYRLFLVALSPGGQPGLTHLPGLDSGGGVMATPEIALSPDGKRLAMSFHSYINGTTGNTRYESASVTVFGFGGVPTREWSTVWSTGQAQDYWPGTPSWSSDNRTLIVPWLRLDVSSGSFRLTGLRMLNTQAPGNDLLAAPLRHFAAPPAISSALVTADGRSIIASYCSLSGTTLKARVVELSAADGHQVSVLRTETEKISVPGSGSSVAGMVAVSCPVLSADPSGQHMLIDAFTFGRLDDGRFTPLPGGPADSAANFGAAW